MFLYLGLWGCQTQTKVEDTSTTVESQWNPTYYCPGSEGCEDAEGALYVGAAAVPITPTCFEQWRDCGEDGLCPGDDGYVEPDSKEGNSEWERSFEAFLDCG